MKLLVTGDWHLSDRTPRSRKDDYQEAMNGKIRRILSIAGKNQVEAILQAGDLTDSHDSPDKFKVKWIDRFRNFPKIYTVPGQHDLRYHTSDIWNTPLGVLSQAVAIHTITDNRSRDLFDDVADKRINVYGAGWGQEIPKPDPEIYSILITHRMVVMDKLWAAQENYEMPGTLLRENPGYQLIVSGDNHNSFHYIDGGRFLINCGSLMRSNIDQVDHKPCVWIFDTDENPAEQIYLDVKPFEKVMDIERAEREKAVKDQKNEKLEELERRLKSKSKIEGLNYASRVSERVKLLQDEDSINPISVEIIGEIMGEE